jgi:hypothetical protein
MLSPRTPTFEAKSTAVQLIPAPDRRTATNAIPIRVADGDAGTEQEMQECQSILSA